MKPTTLLTTLLLSTPTTSAAATRQPPRLLHTYNPSLSPSTRLLSTLTTTDSTKGGALLTLPRNTTSSPITHLTTTFRLPPADPPTSGPTANNPVGVYAASFWLGIDSVSGTCNSSLRAGVDIFWDGTLGGPQAPYAWFQYMPGETKGFEGFAVEVGDLVRLTLGVTGEGKDEKVEVGIENFGKGAGPEEGGKAVREAREVVRVGEGQQQEGGMLCGREAAWVVEDFPLAGLPQFPVALANFTEVVFDGNEVGLGDGSETDLAGAEVVDVRMEAQGGRLTKCEVVGDSQVRCKRVLGDE